MKKNLLSPRQVAAKTGYSEEYIRLLIRTGKIKSSKPNGGRLFVSADALDDFIMGGKDM